MNRLLRTLSNSSHPRWSIRIANCGMLGGLRGAHESPTGRPRRLGANRTWAFVCVSVPAEPMWGESDTEKRWSLEWNCDVSALFSLGFLLVPLPGFPPSRWYPGSSNVDLQRATFFFFKRQESCLRSDICWDGWNGGGVGGLEYGGKKLLLTWCYLKHFSVWVCKMSLCVCVVYEVTLNSGWPSILESAL